jgi:hypothetical protein
MNSTVDTTASTATTEATANVPTSAPAPQKWTAGAALGPRMAKEFNQAIKDLSWAARTVRELSGVIGGEERGYDFVQLCGGPTHPEHSARLCDIGNRYNWTVGADNYKRIVADLIGAAAWFKANPMIVDKRLTPEAHTQQEIERNKQRAINDARIAAEASAEESEMAKAKALYPWAKRDGSHQANGAANMRRLLADAFPGIKFAIKSDSYSMGSSIDVNWEDGPTSAQVKAISDQFQSEDFNGMIDMSEGRDTGEGFRNWMGYAKSVHENRRMSVETGTVLDSAFRAKLTDDAYPADAHGNACRLFDKTSLPPGAVVTGIEWKDDEGFVAKFEAPSTPAPTAAPIESPSGVTVRENSEKDGIEIRFPAKPAPTVIESLKAAGWRWSRFSSCWWHKRTSDALAFAHSLAGTDEKTAARAEEDARAREFASTYNMADAAY